MRLMRGSARYFVELLPLTAAHVSMPRFNASSAMKLPMNPEAPVMRIFMGAKLLRKNELENKKCGIFKVDDG